MQAVFGSRRLSTKEDIVWEGGEHMEERKEWHMPEIKELDVSSTEAGGSPGIDAGAYS